MTGGQGGPDACRVGRLAIFNKVSYT